MALCGSNRRAGGATLGENRKVPRETGPSPLAAASHSEDRECKVKNSGGEALAVFDYGKGNITPYFRRIFPYTSRRTISSFSAWAPSTAASPPAETAFFSSLAQFEGLVGGHLLIDGDCEGSATLLSPPLAMGDGRFLTFWVTAAHNCISRKGRLYSIKVNPQVYQSPKDWSEDSLARDERLTHDLEVVRCGMRDYLLLFDQDDHSPTKFGELDKFSKPNSDLAFCRVICANAHWPFSSSEAIKFAVPNSAKLQAGDFILKLGYPGHVSKDAFVQKYRSALPRSRLDAEFLKLDGFTLRTKTFSASPSEVYLVGKESRVIKDKGSSWPGMSGGPTLNLKRSYLLDGVHIGAAMGRDFNHFLSVHHPFFACAYAELLGPFLAMIQWPRAEMDVAAQEYLRLHKPLLRRASLWSKEVELYVTGRRNMPGLVSSTERKRHQKTT